MTIINFILNLILEGLIFLRNYVFFPGDGQTFSLIRILSLFIAFSISGAIVVFMSQGAVLKHMGPKAKPFAAYTVASVSGVILAVCSCSVLPMFASIRKKGAGIGPAIAFLFSGPAINILALTLTFTDIGADIAIARILGSIILAMLIGFTMYLIYHKKEERDLNSAIFNRNDSDQIEVKNWQRALFFLTLFAILIFGVYRPLPTVFFVLFLVVQLALFFKIEDIKRWAYETWILAKKILPLFVVGIFFAGVLNALITPEMLTKYVGQNTYVSNLLASVTGATMYFATMTEVPIVRTLLANGMHRGPATALLLAGPSLSLPNMIIISKVIGFKRAMTYIGLVVLLSALVGLIAGILYFI
jgi:uncharacterized membrane protein YraQ (UPF0718 family)